MPRSRDSFFIQAPCICRHAVRQMVDCLRLNVNSRYILLRSCGCLGGPIGRTNSGAKPSVGYRARGLLSAWLSQSVNGSGSSWLRCYATRRRVIRRLRSAEAESGRQRFEMTGDGRGDRTTALWQVTELAKG